MIEWADDLKLTDRDLYLDARNSRSLSLISHGHSDHIALHTRSIATPATAALARYRLGAAGQVDALDYRQPLIIEDPRGAIEVQLRPAGHVLGSAMLHARTDAGSLLYTGDFKLRASLTCDTADPIEADVLVMESTYGLPMFRFPDWKTVASELVDRCANALRDGRQPIVMGYSLGKAQEITRILTDAGLIVTQHGACHAMTQLYEQFNASCGTVRRYRYEDFHGPATVDLSERGVLVAPPSCARSSFVTRFSNPLRIMCSGWGLLSGAQYRYGVDHVLPLSDHADFDELIELIDRVRPKKIFTHHGYPQFAEILQSRGLDAKLARPDPQLSLFGD
jgi:Cft2 family RNA processing exonuclease